MSMSNFIKISQSVAKILTFFNFSSWIFKFVKFHWQTVSGRPRLVMVLNVVKIGRTLWRHCNFFWIFKMADAAILDVWNSEILLAIGAERVETQQHAKLCQNRSIVVKILTFFRFFQDGCRRHLRFSKWWIFIYWRYLEGQDASLYQILLKSVVPLRRYCDLSKFQNGRRRHLGFLK